jgi:hypothetical protein
MSDIVLTLGSRMSDLRLPEQHASYFPIEAEVEILAPHLIEYFKHPCRAKARKDEIAPTVSLFEDLHPKK